MLGKIEGRERREQQKMKWLDGITDSRDMSLSKFWGMVKDREVWHLQFMQSQRAGHNLATEQQGYSLVVQWLRLHGPNAGGPGLIPNQGDRSHMQLKIT